MVIPIVRKIAFPILILVILISSIILNHAPNVTWMLVAGTLFFCSVLFEHQFIWMKGFQFFLLGAFHYSSQLNWCEVLYFLLIVLNIYSNPHFRVSLAYTSLAVLEYTLIRLSYQPLDTYNVLVTMYDLAAAFLLVLVVQHLLRAEQASARLEEQTHYLTTHDPLTGLLNYQGYLTAIQELVDTEQPFVLIVMDLQDFKSYNSSGIQNGNEILMKISSNLKKLFRDAHALSRYAGDRFAIALPDREGREEEIRRLLHVQQIGFHFTYSVTHFPKEAATASVLISMAEDRLFQNKRSVWLLQEEKRFQEEKLRMVGELAAGMAHEIRNPLTTIKGFMQLAKTNNYSTEPWFDLITSEISRMSELTAEFLQFAKPHISNMKSEILQNCINRVLFLTESEAALHGHVVLCEKDCEQLEVWMDRDKIVQVLLNLMRNAMEAMKEPGTVHVRVYRHDGYGVIEIQDSGNGIPENDLGKIFDPFYTTKENGTGLGLSICKKIIQDHGGELEANSRLGEGSVFTVKLPVFDPQRAAAAPAQP